MSMERPHDPSNVTKLVSYGMKNPESRDWLHGVHPGWEPAGSSRKASLFTGPISDFCNCALYCIQFSTASLTINHITDNGGAILWTSHPSTLQFVHFQFSNSSFPNGALIAGTSSDFHTPGGKWKRHQILFSAYNWTQKRKTRKSAPWWFSALSEK